MTAITKFDCWISHFKLLGTFIGQLHYYYGRIYVAFQGRVQDFPLWGARQHRWGAPTPDAGTFCGKRTWKRKNWVPFFAFPNGTVLFFNSDSVYVNIFGGLFCLATCLTFTTCVPLADPGIVQCVIGYR